MKVVINKCYGGFSLSDEAMDFVRAEDRRHHPRNDPKLVECVEKLGTKANGQFADLCIVEIPDDVDWHIESYDGIESIHEDHRVWS